MKIFYHNDMDGKCAAHVINSYDDWPTPSSSFHAINYGMEFPLADIEEAERVYILDYSIEPEEMKKLLAITEDVIWIDHHKTAIEKYQDFLWEPLDPDRTGDQGSILGLRSVEMAGCCLAYKWVRVNRSPYQHMPNEMPYYIRLIGDRDTWAWKYGETTKEFFAGLQAEDTFPRAPIWDKLRWDEDLDTLNNLGSNGRVIQKYKDRTQQEAIRENGFWVDFVGYKCYAMCGRWSSQPFEAVVPEADIWLPFTYLHGCWTVYLYSTKVDVSEIAKTFSYKGKRGGGHKGAAGFQCGYPPFLATPDYPERG